MSVVVMLDASRAERGKHFDFHDRPEHVFPAVEKIDAFFKATVGPWRQAA
jgi:hypothetical protein